IPRLLEYIEQSNHDVVYGTPIKPPYGVLRRLATLATKLALSSIMGSRVAQQVSALRAFRAEVAEAFQNYEGPYVSIDVLLAWGTSGFGALKVDYQPRQDGKSGYSLRKLITHTMNMITSFSALPLQFASLIGFSFTVFGFAVFGYVLIRFMLHGDPVPGFPFLASIISLFAGPHLFALGILGEYLGRIYFRSMQKPPYVVRQHGSAPEKEKTREARMQ